MFADMDCSLRELGIGDMGIARRVKSLARNLYGRIAAYEDGLEAGAAVLVAALGRNVYATVEAPRPEQVTALASYMAREAAALRGQQDAQLLAGRVVFGSAPSIDAVAAETAP
jgi:cytochrome b pre-mRNA-processing protein 3